MFRTPVSPKISTEKIDLSNSLLLSGSCFSEHIGQKLSEYKFDNLTNSFGVIYNPVSIFKLLINALLEKPVDEKYILKNQGIYRHYDFHSDISALNKNELIARIDEAYKYTKIYLLKSRWIIITFGTAIVYHHKKLKDLVGNCHKIPGRDFDKRILHPDEICKAFRSFYEVLSGENNHFNIILTVSPVRHLKDTLETNGVSKSILRYACNTLTETFENVQYFPAYEIMMDDLRDYRFYGSDMLHPNASAIEYIWEAFQKCYFDNKTIAFIKEWKKIRNAINHKPFYPDSKEHQEFIKNTIKLLKTFSQRVDITKELRNLEKQLK
jgi:hypothetical protein